MDAGVDPVTKRDVVRQLVQFSVDVQYVPIGSGIGVEREAVRAWNKHVPPRRCEQRPNLLTAVKEELQQRAARAAYRSVTRGIARVRRRTFRERLWQQITAVGRKDERKRPGLQDVLVQRARRLRKWFRVHELCVSEAPTVLRPQP